MRIVRWLLLLVLLAILRVDKSLAEEGGEEEEEDKEEEEEPSNYMYEFDAGPVLDFILPETGTEEGGVDDPEVKPDFLYGSNQGYRIVEFYAPWCPHCQHFRDHYVEFAEQIIEMAKRDANVDVTVHAVSCSVHRTVCHDFDVHGYPKIKLFAAGDTNVTATAEYFALHPFDVLNKLGIQVEMKLEPTTTTAAGSTKTTNVRSASSSLSGARKKPVRKRTKQDVYNDANLSFHFALRNAIFMTNGPLSEKEKKAFEEWLVLLKRTLPPTWNIHNLIRALGDNFDKITKSEKALLKVVDKYPPIKKTWSAACTKGEKAAGYTCGLWELFHIVTVGLVEWNRLITTDDWTMVLGTEDAAVAIRNYVEHFFGCEVCRTNFVGAFDACAHDRCHRLDNDSPDVTGWRELPLWLFETHNAVNVRLMTEQAERVGRTSTTQQDQLDAQWPPRDECPQCWRDDGGWQEENMFRYIRLEYWPEDAESEELRRELLESTKNQDDAYANDGFPQPPLAVRLFPFAALIGLGVAWYLKKVERQKSGLHKKIDR